MVVRESGLGNHGDEDMDVGGLMCGFSNNGVI